MAIPTENIMEYVMIISHLLSYPYAPCMEYLPTFALNIAQM